MSNRSSLFENDFDSEVFQETPQNSFSSSRSPTRSATTRISRPSSVSFENDNIFIDTSTNNPTYLSVDEAKETDEIPTNITVDIYNDFSHIREKRFETNKCLAFDSDREVYDVFITDEDGNPVKFTHSYDRKGHGKIVTVNTKNNKSFTGKFKKMDGNSVEILSDGRLITIFDPSEIIDERKKECSIKIITKELPKNCKNTCAKEYTLTYFTPDITWNSEIIAHIEKDKIKLKLYANICNASRYTLNANHVNLIMGKIKYSPGNYSKNYYPTRSFALNSIVNSDNAEDYRMISMKEDFMIHLDQKFAIKTIEYDCSKVIRCYFLDNNVVQYGYRISSAEYIPESRLLAYKKINKLCETSEDDYLFIGESNISEVQENDYFYLKLGSSTKLSVDTYEYESGDEIIFTVKVINRNINPSNLFIKYYTKNKNIGNIIGANSFDRKSDYIMIFQEVPSSRVENKNELVIYTYTIRFAKK